MKAMCSHIIIGDYAFAYVSRVTVDSSWKNMGDTCTIELPNAEGRLDKYIKPGMPVEVQLGYDDALRTEFTGYVVRVAPGTPLRIECMDEMWQLKQDTISKSWKTVTLAEVLKFIAPDALLDSVPSMVLAPFRLDKVTRAEALSTIKEMYGLAVYFRGPQLFVGLPYTERGLAKRVYHFQKNALVGGLAYRRKDDVKVTVKAISIMPDNSRIELELGDKSGEQHTLHFYNLDKVALKQQGEEKLSRLKFDGYSGAFDAFGDPNIEHTAIVQVQDDKYADRAGDYFADAVRTSYGADGYRRNITLGPVAGNASIV